MSDFRLPENLSGIRIHMVGIKGTGMAAFAEILSGAGAVLTGSDVPEQFYTDEILKKLNIVSPEIITELCIDMNMFGLNLDNNIKTINHINYPPIILNILIKNLT